MLRIVQIVPDMRQGGAERVVADYCRGLAKKGCDVHLLSTGKRQSYLPQLKDASVNVHLLKEHGGVIRFYDVATRARIKRRISETLQDLAPDIVHCHLPSALEWSAPAVVSSNLRCFYTVHGYHFVPRPREWRHRWEHRRFASALRKTCCHLLAVSLGAARHAEEVFALTAGSVQIQPNPIDLSIFTAGSVEKRLPIALMVGTLYPLKRVNVGIAAIEMLCQQDECDLWIAGTGPQANDLRDLVRKSADREHIKFLGQCSGVQNVYKQVEMLWVLSEREGYGLVAAEAMACGVPVITTNVASNEFLVHEENCLVVPVDDPGAVCGAALRLRQEVGLRNKLVEGGLRSVSKYDLPTVTELLLEKYEDVVR